MHIKVISLFPELYKPFLEASLIGRARQAGTVSLDVENLADFSSPGRRVDSPVVGHGSGMLIRPELVEKALSAEQKSLKIFFSPHGRKLNQTYVEELATKFVESGNVVMVPARYEGMDARVEAEYADEIVSIGDYVMMGGDLAAMVLIETVLRRLPGVVGSRESVESDSFVGALVDYPEFTKPDEWRGRKIPEILKSGNHAKIEAWRRDAATERTVLGGHFAWFRANRPSAVEIESVKKHIPNHYAALLHTGVRLKDGKVGTTSVTSFDIHDIARSARTYGLKNYYIVTPLKDQTALVSDIISFWREGDGRDYNPSRSEAIDRVCLITGLEKVIQQIEEKEGKKPIVIGTSARRICSRPFVSFSDQACVWKERRPVLIIFGTGWGLAEEIVQLCDYVFPPILGLEDYNHLSVRSAAAIVFDRWLGLNPQAGGCLE